jgi:hypothetical protein
MDGAPSESMHLRMIVNSVGGLYYASSFLPMDGRDHYSCTKSLCRAVDIDNALYQTAHTKADCTCKYLGLDMHEVGDIIRKGDVPVVVCTTSGFLGGLSMALDIPFFR